ncbi:hypothetical protein NBRC116592_11750 [Colwellia sp. KU-HH00111]|uniref:DUF6387 family protein n=1 Tax=Colwellia sp. KU-HH00111 TaxID=3127652 RepID=UPI003106CAAB
MKDYEWFNLDSYNDVKKLTFSQLIKELKLRNWMLSDEMPYGHKDLGSIIWNKEQLTTFWANKIVTGKPFASVYGENFYYAHLPFTTDKILKNTSLLINNFDTPNIAAVTEEYIDLIHKSFQPLKVELKTKGMESTFKEMNLQPVRVSKSTVIASIDLARPINQLLSEFKRFVINGQESLRVVKKPNNKWKSEKVHNIFNRHTLPILDLKVFSKHSKIHITIEEICDLIYQDLSGDKIASFNTNDYPTAKKIISSSEIKTLESMLDIDPSLTSTQIINYL